VAMSGTDEICPRDKYLEHMSAFVSAFVLRERRERWLHLLSHRPKQLFKNSSKLHNHLDRRYCAEIFSYESLAVKGTGVFADFHDSSDPLLVSAGRAMELGAGTDALFSVLPGSFAVYFFHEDSVIVCRK
jgi:hypothetical protein